MMHQQKVSNHFFCNKWKTTKNLRKYIMFALRDISRHSIKQSVIRYVHDSKVLYLHWWWPTGHPDISYRCSILVRPRFPVHVRGMYYWNTHSFVPHGYTVQYLAFTTKGGKCSAHILWNSGILCKWECYTNLQMFTTH